MLRLDLHCHSRHSDGTDSASDVARMARANGVRLFCLTDHDGWLGTDEAMAALSDTTVLRGMELSAHHENRTVHLLVYGWVPGAGFDELAATVAVLQQQRRDRVVAICERLHQQNVDLDPRVVWDLAGHAPPGRPHVARALVNQGVVRSVREAFDRFLRDNGPGAVPSPRLPVVQALALATAASARVALAHPHLLGAPDVVARLCRQWRPLGLGGLEAVYGLYDRKARRSWCALADGLGMVATAGSDYHGIDVMPAVKSPGMDLDDDRARRLCDWLQVDVPVPR